MFDESDATLPHGRLWVYEKGCRCAECSERFEQVKSERAKRMEVRGFVSGMSTPLKHRRGHLHQVQWRKTPRRGWVVQGPVDKVCLGRMFVRNHLTAKVSEVEIVRLGHPFELDGLDLVYGYPRRG